MLPVCLLHPCISHELAGPRSGNLHLIESGQQLIKVLAWVWVWNGLEVWIGLR